MAAKAIFLLSVLFLSFLLSLICTFHSLLCQCCELPSLGFLFSIALCHRTLTIPPSLYDWAAVQLTPGLLTGGEAL